MMIIILYVVPKATPPKDSPYFTGLTCGEKIAQIKSLYSEQTNFLLSVQPNVGGARIHIYYNVNKKRKRSVI